MDLPTCPACGQSVLDDDAAECPFCGSSMKPGTAAKAPPKLSPAAAKAAPKAAATPAATSRPTPPPPTKAAAKPAAKKSDDPFDIDVSAAAGAVLASPKASKQRPLEVTCPMCETVGFIPTTAAGHDVKCPNPKCIAPVFKAPKPKVVEAPPPPPKPKPNYIIWGSLVGGALIGGGFLVYMMLFSPKVPPSLPPFIPPKPTTTTGTTAEKTETTPDGTTTGTKTPLPTGPKLEEVQSVRLANLIEAAREAKSLKAYCRRLAAAGAAQAGQIETARGQISQLKTAERDTDDDAIVPLTMIAWRQLAAADPKAKETIDDAVAKSARLERQGWYRAEAVLELAAVLSATGRNDEARKILALGSAGRNLDSMVAALETVRAERGFDLDEQLVGRSVGEWQHPLEVGVTLVLCGRGRQDEALAWARGLPDLGARSECQVVWGIAVARDALAAKQPLDKVTAVQADFSPGEKARLLARVAQLQLQAGDQNAAAASLTSAREALAAVKVPTSVVLTNLKQVLDLKLPEPARLQQAAQGAVDIARTELLLKQPPDAAWKDVQTALTILKGTSPSMGVVTSMQERARNLSQVRTDLKINNDDLARRRQSECQTALRTLQAAASIRFRQETAVLLAAIDAGLLTEVRAEIESRTNHADPNEQADFVHDSPVSGVLVSRAETNGKPDIAKEVRAMLGEEYAPTFITPLYEESTRQRVDANDMPTVISLLSANLRSDGTLYEWALRLVCRLVRAGRHEDALTLLGSTNELLKVEGVRIGAALAAKTGQGTKFEEACLERFKSPADRASLYAGLIEGTELATAPAAGK